MKRINWANDKAKAAYCFILTDERLEYMQKTKEENKKKILTLMLHHQSFKISKPSHQIEYLHNFIKYWQSYKMLSLAHSAINLQCGDQ